jgi:hypothetical protein
MGRRVLSTLGVNLPPTAANRNELGRTSPIRNRDGGTFGAGHGPVPPAISARRGHRVTVVDDDYGAAAAAGSPLTGGAVPAVPAAQIR